VQRLGTDGQLWVHPRASLKKNLIQ